ncbi:MAG: magnesium chelatase, partial [Proteobacteria bacterium]|nr:magnesium chelatase [Pseudomonadota bacterium]
QRAQQRGLSSRAGIDLVRASKAWAYINARDFVLPDDVKFIFPFVAGHRLPLQELGVKIEQDLAREILKDVSVL